MNGKDMKVLIVEDNPGDAFMIREMLGDLHLELKISMAKDGQEALDMLVRGGNDVPNMVILDLNLPKVDGFGVLKFMKEKPTFSSIPVVVMTGSSRKEDEIRSRDMGAVDYCFKPATAEEIEGTITCLRHNLESLPTNGKDEHTGPGASMNFHPFLQDLMDQPVPPPHCDGGLTDLLSFDPWK